MTARRKNTILVTGGSGFVGRHLVGRLAEWGRSVVATTTRSAPPIFPRPNLEWVTWDARGGDTPDIDWDRIDAIVHLAKPRDALNGRNTHTENYALSVAATMQLLQSAKTHGVRRFVFASTGYVLGPCDGPALEHDRPFRPREHYGAFKACGELIVTSFANDVATASVRFFFPYGSGGEKFFVNRIARAVREGQEIRIDGDAGVRLNPIWIDDLIQGLLLAIESDARGVFHLAGPETVTLQALATQIGELAQRKPLFRHVPAERVDWHVGDFCMARKVLGFEPATPLRQGLPQLIGGFAETHG